MKQSDLERYARHIALPEIGQGGQERLLQSKVLVVGAGGLGAPLLMYLAAAGVGRLGIVDHDRVALSNLQRQVIYETGDVGQWKVESARTALHDLNPDIYVIAHAEKLTAENAETLFAPYNLIVDGSDNFETRLLVNDQCHKMRKTLISAAVSGFSGQIYTFKSYLGAPHPCYRCLYPAAEAASENQPCNGVLGSMAGLMGSWQATEVIKELLGIGESLSGSMLLVDGLSASIRKIQVPRNHDCQCCAH